MKTTYLKSIIFLLQLGLLLVFAACKPKDIPEDAGVEGGLSAEVLGMAGSTETYTWDGNFQSLPSPTALPAPGYFGYFPQQTTQAGQQPFEMLLLGQRISTGTNAVAPLGILRYRERESGKEGALVVAVPLRASEKTVMAVTFREFLMEYDALKRTIEIWVQQAAGFSSREILRWEDEAVAVKAIKQGF